MLRKTKKPQVTRQAFKEAAAWVHVLHMPLVTQLKQQGFKNRQMKMILSVSGMGHRPRTKTFVIGSSRISSSDLTVQTVFENTSSSDHCSLPLCDFL